MIIIFAGAGASTAVNKEQFPTTADFFNKLSTRIKDDKLFQLIISYLRQEKTGIDIEHILWEISTLLTFAEAGSTDKNIIGWILGRNRLQNTVGIGLSSEPVIQALIGLHGKLISLEKQINQQVYEFYGENPEKRNLENNWIPLLRSLIKTQRSIEIFTTNYDIVLERCLYYLEQLGHSSFPCQTVTGRDDPLTPIFMIDAWEHPHVPPYMRLTKLHGSVDWIKRGEKIHTGSPVFTGNHENHVIIYPGFKGAPNQEPFSMFHRYLEKCVDEAQAMIFIGFAFRDDYVNSVLRRADASTVKIIINPDQQVDTPFGEELVHRIDKGFNRTSAKECVGLVRKFLTAE